MMKLGIKRYYLPQGKQRCEQCGQSLNRVFRLHPFPMPEKYGRGMWLKTDCECVKKQQANIREKFDKVTVTPVTRSALPVALREHSFTNFRTDLYNKEAHTVCKQFARNFAKLKDGKGLLICGRSGRGKTHLACAILNHLDDNYSTAFAHTPTLLEKIRKGAGNLGQLLAVDLLVLDDIGSERESDWALEKILIIVDGRLNQLKPTVFTTNFDYNDLETRIGSRLASRILNSSLTVVVQGPDWREVKYRQGGAQPNKKTMRS